MSGIFIKDMWLPEHCGACPLAMLNGYGERRCFVTDSTVTEFDSNGWPGGRSGDCPMIEVEERETTTYEIL